MLREVLSVQQIGLPILSPLIALPALWALLLLFVERPSRLRWIALLGAGVELALALALVAAFRPGTPDLQLVERYPWIPSVGAEIHLGVDGISVLFIPLTALLFVALMLSSWSGPQARSKVYLAALLGLEAVTVGVFCALDLVLFFVFWELMLVPLYLLVSLSGIGPDRRRAALKLVTTMLIGSAPLLVAILLLGQNHLDAARAAGLPAAYSFDYLALLRAPIAPGLQGVIFALLIVGFAVKSPLLPFHAWLPSTVMEGPISVAVLLTGVKLGAYGILRFALPLAPEASARWLAPVAAAGAFGIVYGALIALVQPNLRRLLAFSSVSHVGAVTLGVATLTRQGLEGALLQMLHIGVISTGLMLLVGFLHARAGTSEIASLGGVARRAPLLAGSFLLLGAASLGLPGTGGFHGEHLILLGAFRATPAWAVLALAGVVLGAAGLLKAFERAFLGPERRAALAALRDLRPRERIVAGAMALLVIATGLWPAPILDVTGPSIEALIQRVHPEARPALAARLAPAPAPAPRAP